jgi:hypothetical protein
MRIIHILKNFLNSYGIRRFIPLHKRAVSGPCLGYTESRPHCHIHFNMFFLILSYQLRLVLPSYLFFMFSRLNFMENLIFHICTTRHFLIYTCVMNFISVCETLSSHLNKFLEVSFQYYHPLRLLRDVSLEILLDIFLVTILPVFLSFLIKL